MGSAAVDVLGDGHVQGVNSCGADLHTLLLFVVDVNMMIVSYIYYYKTGLIVVYFYFFMVIKWVSEPVG